jgi:hypothetical protein
MKDKSFEPDKSKQSSQWQMRSRDESNDDGDPVWRNGGLQRNYRVSFTASGRNSSLTR